MAGPRNKRAPLPLPVARDELSIFSFCPNKMTHLLSALFCECSIVLMKSPFQMKLCYTRGGALPAA